jgi:Ca2+-binding RTX toxin-like protein
LIAGAGNDRLEGVKGDDTLRGDAGNDTLNGGEGFDFISYWIDPNASDFNSMKGAVVNLSTGKATDPWGQEDSLISVEGVHGSSLGDNFTGDAVNNNLYGNDGNDFLQGLGGNDNLNGGNGNDTLIGGPGSDYLDGADGFDRVIYLLSLNNYKVIRNTSSRKGWQRQHESH